MLTLYFSGTGNTEYLAKKFSERMAATCFSIEETADFPVEIAKHEEIAICYPIYGSRVPLIMREFVAANMANLQEKRLIILVTQMIFSGDGARVLCDLFPQGVNVIYAEHFLMPNNICNFPLFRRQKNSQAKLAKMERKLTATCENIRNSVIKKRGFSSVSRILGKIQGKSWQGDSKNAHVADGTMEYKAKNGVQIDADCNACGLCVNICPMKNLETDGEKISHKNNCTVCYRCVNRCPKQAITVFLHSKPKWQYKFEK